MHTSSRTDLCDCDIEAGKSKSGTTAIGEDALLMCLGFESALRVPFTKTVVQCSGILTRLSSIQNPL